mmetsp:Transcript_20835/g.69551  ORF Transcript_20835/g.69551 Transcript_20835/m.69551 type:complete len:80 (+) Transcript_20835:3316-3555(+)
MEANDKTCRFRAGPASHAASKMNTNDTRRTITALQGRAKRRSRRKQVLEMDKKGKKVVTHCFKEEIFTSLLNTALTCKM